MTINLMDQYIDIVKKQITTYMKAVFTSKFKKEYLMHYLYRQNYYRQNAK